MQVKGTFGRTIGSNPDYVLLRDSTKGVITADTYIYAGMPLALFPDGSDQFKLASVAYLSAQSKTMNVRPYGLAEFSKNAYKDDTSDANDYGGRVGTVILAGKITLSASVFRVNDANVLVYAFDTTQTYLPMQKLYVNCDSTSPYFGKITNQLVSTSVASRNDETFIGYVAGFFNISATEKNLEVLIALA